MSAPSRANARLAAASVCRNNATMPQKYKLLLHVVKEEYEKKKYNGVEREEVEENWIVFKTVDLFSSVIFNYRLKYIQNIIQLLQLSIVLVLLSSNSLPVMNMLIPTKVCESKIKKNEVKNSALFVTHLKTNNGNSSKLASFRKIHAINFSYGATAFKITSNIILG